MNTRQVNYDDIVEIKANLNILDPRWKPLSQDFFSLIALMLVVMNDYLIKASPFAGLVSGKISDFAGMYFLPMLVADLLLMFSRSRRQANESMILAMIVSSALVVAIKLSPLAGQLCAECFAVAGIKARFVSDATDLFSLAMLPLAYLRFLGIKS